MSVNASSKRPRPEITVISARPLSEVGFRDTAPKPSSGTNTSEVKMRQPPARPGAPPGRPPLWRKSMPPQTSAEIATPSKCTNGTAAATQSPMPAPRSSIRPVSLVGGVSKSGSGPMSGSGISNKAFESNSQQNRAADPEALLISFDDEPLVPVSAHKLTSNKDLLTPDEAVYAVVNKKRNPKEIEHTTDSVSSMTPPVPARCLDQGQRQTDSIPRENVSRPVSGAQPTPLALLNKDKGPFQAPSQIGHPQTVEQEKVASHQMKESPDKESSIRAHGVPVFPMAPGHPLKKTAADQRGQTSPDAVKPSPAVKPLPAQKPKPAVKPKPAIKPKPAVKSGHVSAPVTPSDQDSPSFSTERKKLEPNQKLELPTPAIRLHSDRDEEDDIARKTKEQEASVSNIISAMRAKLEKSQTESSSGLKPVKATYRPTIIRPQAKKALAETSSTSVESSDNLPMEEKRSSNSRSTRSKPTIIRARTSSQTKMNLEESDTSVSAGLLTPNKNKGFMSSAVSMPNLAGNKLHTGTVEQDWPGLGSSEEIQNISNEMIAADLTHEAKEPVREDMEKTTSAGEDKSKQSPDNTAEDSYTTCEEIEFLPSVNKIRRHSQGLPPPRPSTGPQAESADSAQKAARQPPPRPSFGPTPGKAQQSVDKTKEPPPELPPRPGPGHPLFHYVVTEPHAIALFDYEATHDDELSFKSGDVILLTSRVDDQWLLGRLLNAEGIFPVSFVDVVKPPTDDIEFDKKIQLSKNFPSSPEVVKVDVGSGPRCRARFDYEGEEPEDLTFEAGDIIKLVERVGDEWFKGELKGQTGLFPASYVEIIEQLPTDQKEEALNLERDNVVTAIYDFEGEANELSFKSGDKIHVVSQVNDDWLFGSLRGVTGSFPASFVDRVPQDLPKHQVALPDTVDNIVVPDKPEPAPDAYCVASYDFDGDTADDLYFKKGDRITLLAHVNDDWLKGRIGDRVGIFPKGFVEILKDVDEPVKATGDISLDSSARSNGRALAKFDFEGEADGDLSFSTGQEIILLEKISDDWLRGRIGDHEGIFPAAFVDVTVPL